MLKFFPKMILLVFFISGCKSSGNKTVTDTLSQIEFKKSAYDFGVIPADYEGTCEFEFENASDAPLVINDVKTSCGCTSPEWTTKPVMPGENECKVTSEKSSGITWS
jgi:hypothetical protein